MILKVKISIVGWTGSNEKSRFFLIKKTGFIFVSLMFIVKEADKITCNIIYLLHIQNRSTIEKEREEFFFTIEITALFKM